MRAAICAGCKRRRLTPRETEIALALAAGATWKSAADRLGISIRTVQFHIVNLRVKIGAENSAQAIAILLLN
jgi:Response regulator containing a CheY-like receiver domain and an HTH DNA-binding domain